MTLAHLVARAAEAAPSREALQALHDRMPIAITAVGVTTILFIVLLVAVDYTYGTLIGTLAFVESPIATVITSTPPPASPKQPLLEDLDGKKAGAEHDDVDAPPPYEEEILLVRSRPITASLRGSLQHLRARVGSRRAAARFRGLTLFVLHSAAVQLLSSFLVPDPTALTPRDNPLPAFLAVLFSRAVAAVVASPLRLAWTHFVLADPAAAPGAPWLRRVFGLKWPQIKRVLLPAALLALAEQLAIVPPLAVVIVLAMFNNLTPLAAMLALAFSLVTVVALVFPAQAVFVRVAASTAPADEDCVVPFDRSFGGHAQDGQLGVVAAWRSFGWAARFRVLGLYAKVAGIEMALFLGWIVLVVAEVRLIVGTDISWPKKNGDYFF